VPILPSAGTRIQELLRRLESPATAERESAVARLTLLGPRVIPHIQDLLGKAKAPGRLAALEVLEGVGEVHAFASVLPLVTDANEDVARRAIQISAGFPDPRTAEALGAVLSSGSPSRRSDAARSLGRLHRVGLVEAVLPLLGLLLDKGQEDSLRLQALESLSSLDRRTLLPALEVLTRDPSPAVVRAARELTTRLSGVRSSKPVAGAARDVLADFPTLLSRLESAHTSATEVATILETLVERRSPALLPVLVRRLEALGAGATAGRTEAAARARARLHLALGALGSRLALYDLREMLMARPVYAARDLLAAVELVGEGSFVEVLAELAADEPRLVQTTAAAFRAIAGREKLRRTSRPVKALGPRHKAALELLWPEAASRGASREQKRKPR
jgi:HEAT repeat protein